ncbi:glutathione S-transferase [Mycena vulgaris]|nr:glutathione S-transferase [Mycena vulgaris]
MSLSTCTLRVAVVLAEKKVLYEFVAIDLSKGEHKSPAFLAAQPFGQVPYLDDDGFIVYESRAICRYIADKYAEQGTKLVPIDVKGKALFEQAASIEYSNFDPFCSKAVGEMIFKPIFGGTSDKTVFDGLIAGLSAKLDAYEVILGKQKYLAGDMRSAGRFLLEHELTLADLFHLPYGTMLAMTGSDLIDHQRPEYHQTRSRWFNEISVLPSWVAVKDGAKTTTH